MNRGTEVIRETVDHVKGLDQNPLWILRGIYSRVNQKIHKWYSSGKERFWVLGDVACFVALLPPPPPQAADSLYTVHSHIVHFTLSRSGRTRSALASSQQCPGTCNLCLSTNDPRPPSQEPWPDPKVKNKKCLFLQNVEKQISLFCLSLFPWTWIFGLPRLHGCPRLLAWSLARQGAPCQVRCASWHRPGRLLWWRFCPERARETSNLL